MIFSKISRKNRVFITVNLIVFLIVLSFQACQKDYSLSVEKMEIPAKCNMGACKIGEIRPETSREPHPTKILFVVDNSLTMSLSQEYLSKGVESLIGDLKGFDTDFYIYSTSDKHIKYNGRDKDDKAVLKTEPELSCSWSAPVDGDSKGHSQAGACPNNVATTFTREDKYMMDRDIAATQGTILKLKADFDEAQFGKLSADLAQVIKSVGTDGDSNESGICTLVRSVYNDSDTKLFSQSDSAAMVVLSDEDDASTISSCLSRTTYEETFSGQSAVSESCAQSNSCSEEKYELVFQQQKKQQSYKNYQLSYQCNTSAPCLAGESCSGVRYTYNLRRPRINYSLLKDVNYRMNLAAVYSAGKKLKMSCYKDRPYTFNFKPYVLKYSRTLNFKCEEWRDGLVDVGAGLLDRNRNLSDFDASTCSSTCDDANKALAHSICVDYGKTFSPVRDLRLNPDVASCSVTCKVKAMATPLPSPFVDHAVTADSVDLRNNSFVLSGATYSDLLAFAQSKGYPEVDTIVRSNSLTTTELNPNYVDAATCGDGNRLCNCSTDAQIAAAANFCNGASGSFLTPGSCQIDLRDVVSTAATTVIYYDKEPTANTRDLRTHSFTDPADTTIPRPTYGSLGAWLNAKFSGRTLSSAITIGTNRVNGNIDPSSSPVPSSVANYSCNDSNQTACTAGDSGWVSTNISGGSTILDCKRSCRESGSVTFYLDNAAEDLKDFCTEATAGMNFIKTTGPTRGTFASVNEYVKKQANLGSNPAYLSCVRNANPKVVLDPTLRTTGLNTAEGSCPNSSEFPLPSTLFATDKLCSNTPIVGTGSLSCTTSTLIINDSARPQLTALPSPVVIHEPPAGLDVCSGTIPISELTYNGTTYSNLREFYNAFYPSRAGDTLAPLCRFVSGSKLVTPAALVSAGTIKKEWSFPSDVLAKLVEEQPGYLTDSFIKRSRYLFGENGFFVSAIIRDGGLKDQEAQCKNTGGDQSAGLKYIQLVTSASSGVQNAVAGEVSSICSSDYSVALSGVSKWIKETVRNTYYFPNFGSESLILKVWLEKSTGETIALNEGIDYEVVGSKLTFINPAIEPKGWLIKYIEWYPIQ